jgi:excisionase family DNA binding protein
MAECVLLCRMAKRDHTLDRLMRLLASTFDEWRRLEAERAGDRRPRPEAPPFVDITPMASLTDVQVARELGCTTNKEARELAPYVADERSGLHDRAVPEGRQRCEAGVKAWRLLRCPRSAVFEQRWCTQHHPTPPAPLGPDRRLSPWDLDVRPDGELVRAVYELTDRISGLEAIVNAALARLERVEERAESVDPLALLTAEQAAELLGVKKHTVYNLCQRNRIPFIRWGRALRFRSTDLDEWLATKSTQPRRSSRRTV